MVQDTSIEAYHATEPEHPESRRRVLAEIQAHSRMNRLNGHWARGVTNREISFLLGKDVNTITPRTNELVKAGAVVMAERRVCRVTGFRAIAWKRQTFGGL